MVGDGSELRRLLPFAGIRVPVATKCVADDTIPRRLLTTTGWLGPYVCLRTRAVRLLRSLALPPFWFRWHLPFRLQDALSFELPPNRSPNQRADRQVFPRTEPVEAFD